MLDAHSVDGQRSDVVAVDLRSWAFGSADGETMAITRVPLPGRTESSPLALRELAFSQLCQKVGAPAPYVRALPAKLQIACMNWGLAQDSQNALLRLANNEVRAVVSERYAAIDDAFLLEVVDDVLKSAGYREDALVRAAATGPHTLLRITVPAFGIAVKRDDIIEWGLDIANSELGLRSVQVTPVTHRLVCANGMRAWKSEAGLRMRHVGDADRLRDQLRDAVPVDLRQGARRYRTLGSEHGAPHRQRTRGARKPSGIRSEYRRGAGHRAHPCAGRGPPSVAVQGLPRSPTNKYVGVRSRERHHGHGARSYRRLSRVG